jgi:uncharacterized repeat protein (TIGR03803 family)
MNRDGSGYQVLRSFGGAGRDGAIPSGRLLISSDGMVYGVTSAGGDANLGTVFRLNLAPVLTAATWTSAGFGFQFETTSGCNYLVQYKERFSDPVWVSWSNIVGNGKQWLGTDTNTYSTSRFYRVIIP